MEQEKPQYTEEELGKYKKKRGAKITDKGWLQPENGKLIIPESAQWKILKGFIWVKKVLIRWLLV